MIQELADQSPWPLSALPKDAEPASSLGMCY